MRCALGRPDGDAGPVHGAGVRIVVLPDPAAVGSAAAEIVGTLVTDHREAVLGLATGASPMTAYAALAARVSAGGLDFRGVTGFAPDEYVGLPPGSGTSDSTNRPRRSAPGPA